MVGEDSLPNINLVAKLLLGNRKKVAGSIPGVRDVFLITQNLNLELFKVETSLSKIPREKIFDKKFFLKYIYKLGLRKISHIPKQVTR